MSEGEQDWSGERVRTWLAARLAASLSDQAAADRRGRGYEDDFDKAAAEEWVCRAVGKGDPASDRARFKARVEELLGLDEYPRTGIHDDRRFEREVRAHLRKLARMTRTNTGFDNIRRFQ